MESVELKSGDAPAESKERAAEAEQGGAQAPEDSTRKATAQIVAKNTLWLIGSQLLGMPIGVLISAVMARKLGAEDYGLFYLITTMAGFAATFSDFGQGGAAQRAIAQDRDNAGMLVSTAIALRLLSFLGGHAVLAGAVWALGYGPEVAVGLCIVAGQTLVTQFGGTAALAARGFERADYAARNMLILQAANASFVLPVLLLGGGLREVLMAQLAGGAVGALADWRLLRRLDVKLRRFRPDVLWHLAREGFGFLILSGVMVLQWNVNAVMLSKLANEEVMGWFAASQRLVGFLVFPCAAVIASLYPTLCRLLREAPEEALATARSALSIVSWIALPVAVCCMMFPDIGIQIFSRESFGPAEDNLRVSAVIVFNLYFAMTLATYLNASGLQRMWALLQLGSVCISSALNLLFIPWFQDQYGNGGLGVLTSTIFSEAFLVAGALYIAPARVLNKAFFQPFGWAFLSAALMAAVAWLVRPFLTSWGAAPIALIVYAGCLRITGVLNPETLQLVRNMLRRRRAAA